MQQEDQSSLPRLAVSNSTFPGSHGVARPHGYQHHNYAGSILLARSSASYSSSNSTNSHSSLSLYQPSDSIFDGARGSDSSSSHDLTNTPPQSFPISVSESRHDKQTHSTEDLKIVFSTALHCYNALDYNQMIFILQRVKLPQEMSQSDLMAIHFGLGLGYYKLSLYEASVSHMLKVECLAKEEEELKGDSSNVCLTSYYLGEIEYTQNKFLSAAAYFENAIKTYCSKSIGEVYRVRVPSLSSLHCKCGTTLRYGSRVMEAVKSYRKGLELAKASSDLDGELSARTSIGNLYQSLGEFGKAVDEYHETVSLAKKLKDYVSLGWAHGNLGNAYLGLMKQEKALHNLETAFELTLAHEPVPHAIGRAYNNLGTAYQSLNDLNKAKEQYELALNQAIYGNDLPGQARVYGNLGNLLMLQNKYDDSITHYTETLSISRDRATHITAYHNRGCARFEKAELQRKSYLEEGLDNTELLTGKKSNLVYIGAEVNDCEEEHKFLNLPDFLCKYYRESQSDLERVVKHHEQTFHDIKGSQRGLSLSVSLFETNMRTFQRLQDCSFFLGQWQQALVYAEQSRARTLGELLLGKHSSYLRSPFRTPLDLPQITSIVQEQSLPVVSITYTGSRLLTWVLVPLRDSPTTNVSINLFQSALCSDQFQGKSFDHLVRYSLSESLIENKINMYDSCDYNTATLLNDLHELIAKPLLHLLKSVLPPDTLSNLKDIIYIADSHSKLIPIAALQDPSSREFLGDRLRFHSMNSLLTLGVVQQLPSNVVNIPLDSSNMCIIGNPTIPEFTYQGTTWKLGRLPYAEEEARRVAHTLQAVPILGNEALKDVILSKINHAKVIHIATHGSSSSGFLIFAGSSRLSLTDEAFARSILLFTEDLEGLTIPAALVVLSSCDSGRGIVKVDGIQGIARSFLLAGAQAVLTSVWRVPDESASFFMHFFYQYLVDGFPSFTALQKAGHSIRCYTKYSGYIHWSGYQLQGREIQFTSSCNKEINRLKEVLGSMNVFPQLKEIDQMKQSLLIDSKYVPSPAENIGVQSDDDRRIKLKRATLYPQRADVQLLLGSLGTHPQEVAIDYIANMHSFYTGGIYWFPGHSPDLVMASLQHVQELLCQKDSGLNSQDLSDYFASITKPILLVLDSFHTLPLSHLPLKELMLKTSVHIILTSHASSLPDKLTEQVHKHLTRGCLLHELKPLHCLSALQRIIYNIISQHDITPMNKEQKILDDIEIFVCGQPALIDITNSLVNECIEQSHDPSEGLYLFYDQVIKVAKIELNKALDREEKENLEAKQKLADEAKVLSAKFGVVTLQRTEHVRLVTEDLQAYNKPAILYAQVLLHFAKLSHLEYLYLCCLSSLYCVPFHSAVLKALENTLNSYRTAPEQTSLQSRLMALKFVIQYPHPVIQMPNSTNQSIIGPTSYFTIPPIVCEAIQLHLTQEDKVVICSLLYHTLDDFASQLSLDEEADPSLFTVLHSIALRGVLVQVVSQEFTLFGKEAMRTVTEAYIRAKFTVKGKESLAELIPEIELIS